MGYLQEIGAWTQREVERRRETRPFAGALHEPGRVKIITEIKRASPSEGPIAPNADAAEVARRRPPALRAHAYRPAGPLQRSAHFL